MPFIFHLAQQLTNGRSDFEGTEGSVESEASVTLECLNCWTVGTINATAASTGIDSAQLSVEFQDVQASFDLALLMNGEQTLSIPIYERGVKHTVRGPIF